MPFVLLQGASSQKLDAIIDAAYASGYAVSPRRRRPTTRRRRCRPSKRSRALRVTTTADHDAADVKGLVAALAASAAALSARVSIFVTPWGLLGGGMMGLGRILVGAGAPVLVGARLLLLGRLGLGRGAAARAQVALDVGDVVRRRLAAAGLVGRDGAEDAFHESGALARRAGVADPRRRPRPRRRLAGHAGGRPAGSGFVRASKRGRDRGGLRPLLASRPSWGRRSRQHHRRRRRVCSRRRCAAAAAADATRRRTGTQTRRRSSRAILRRARSSRRATRAPGGGARWVRWRTTRPAYAESRKRRRSRLAEHLPRAQLPERRWRR